MNVDATVHCVNLQYYSVYLGSCRSSALFLITLVFPHTWSTSCPPPSDWDDPNSNTNMAGTVYFKYFNNAEAFWDIDCNAHLPGARLAKWRNEEEWRWIKRKSESNGKYLDLIIFWYHVHFVFDLRRYFFIYAVLF